MSQQIKQKTTKKTTKSNKPKKTNDSIIILTIPELEQLPCKWSPPCNKIFITKKHQNEDFSKHCAEQWSTNKQAQKWRTEQVNNK